MRTPRKSIEVAENAAAKAIAEFDRGVSSKVFCIGYDPKSPQFLQNLNKNCSIMMFWK
jgi:hypothetical protein